MRLELATLDDAEDLLRVQQESFYEYIEKYGHFEDNPYDMTLHRIKFNINYRLGKYYKIVVDNKIVGGLFCFLLDRDDMMKIAQFYLLPEYQSQGLGQKVLSQIFENHYDIKCWVVDTIYQETKNVKFYEKMGFEIVDVEDADEELSFVTMMLKR